MDAADPHGPLPCLNEASEGVITHELKSSSTYLDQRVAAAERADHHNIASSRDVQNVAAGVDRRALENEAGSSRRDVEGLLRVERNGQLDGGGNGRRNASIEGNSVAE